MNFGAVTSDPVLTRAAWQRKAGAFIGDGTLGPGRELHGPPVAVFPSHSMPLVEVAKHSCVVHEH